MRCKSIAMPSINWRPTLPTAPLKSRGLCRFRDYLTAYAAGPYFKSLVQEAQRLAADLSAVNYCVLLRGGSFTVCNYDSEADYSAEIEADFREIQARSCQGLQGRLPLRAGGHEPHRSKNPRIRRAAESGTVFTPDRLLRAARWFPR